MDNIKKKIGDNLRRFRVSRGLTQSKLAELVGVEDKTISRIEVGGNYPSFDLLIRIADALGYELVDFVNFNDKILEGINELSKDEINTVKKFISIIDEKMKI